MQQNNFSNNKDHDEFDKLVSSMLEDHRIPVDAYCWDEIEKRIKRPKHKKLMWWYIGSAVAIIGLLMLFVDPLNDNLNMNNVATAEITTATPTAEENDLSQKNSIGNHQVIADIDVKKSDNQVEPKQKKQQSFVKTFTSNKSNNSADSLNIANKENQQTLIAEVEKEDVTENAKDSIATKDITEPPSKKTNSAKDIFLRDEPLLIAKAESKNNWSFGLGIGTRGGISLPNQYGDKEYNGIVNSPNYGEGSTTPKPNDIWTNREWDYNYNLPISFGFMVKKDINNIVAIESGLVYTYLTTDMKRYTTNDSNIRHAQKGTLQLHYLGVPANIVVNMWKNDQWNIYASGGAMLEKGVRAHQKITTYKNNEEIGVDVNRKNWIRGSQWSLNGSVGVSYNIVHSWKLYIEPRVSYYFDNNQPMSIRTDKSTLFNLNAGVKFNLK